MPKNKIIYSFFKRIETNDNDTTQPTSPIEIEQTHVEVENEEDTLNHGDGVEVETENMESPTPTRPSPAKVMRTGQENIDLGTLIRDPGERPRFCEYPINQQDEIRMAYIKFGPYQFIMSSYPLSGPDYHPRRFQARWFATFPWLEYSPKKDAAFCFPCYLFTKKANSFVLEGFRNWRKVHSGTRCPFLSHIGKYSNSAHNIAIKCFDDLKNKSCHIDKALHKQTLLQVQNNRLRLATSINVIKWLTFQGCAFRGHNESVDSKNRGNFLEMLKFVASYNVDIQGVVLENAPRNARYTSPTIQREILHVFARKVQNEIRNEIGNAKFCLIVDESRDESKREQMALIVRFVDECGFVKERFLDIVHVRDTTAMTLKREICSTLSHHNLNIKNFRGQGYDGASNMRGEWNGLQALIAEECPYAYYVHCFAHRLQLALVAAAKEVVEVHAFFQNLTFIVNVVSASSKRSDELQATYANEINQPIANDDVETGRGLNQMRTLQRPGDTRWSSHFNSICSLFRLFNATASVLEDLAIGRSTYSQKGDATFALNSLMSFDFIFILHVMKEIMRITDTLCQALQQETQDILNAMNFVSSTKAMIENLRNSGWDRLFDKVKSFCETRYIEVSDMTKLFSDIVRSRRKNNKDSVEHHYRVDIFTAVLDCQWLELESRFSEKATELLILCTSLDPKDNYKSFKVDDICKLVEKFYPEDFSEQDKIRLPYELGHYVLDVQKDLRFQNLSSMPILCQTLRETRKSNGYPLVDRLIRLILTLPVSTATSERVFSAMKIIKTKLRNKMEDDFLKDAMIVYIEKEIAEKFTLDSIIDDFDNMKNRRVQL